MLPAGLLKNIKTGRFHPILFRPGPAPSSSPEDDSQRYKSSGHHTEGFDTLEAANEFIGVCDDFCTLALCGNGMGRAYPQSPCGTTPLRSNCHPLHKKNLSIFLRSNSVYESGRIFISIDGY